MSFEHAAEIWRDFPDLGAGACYVELEEPCAGVADAVAAYCAATERRLAGSTESELPEIKAWRRAFSRMGLKPTQYRCASESLLRRFRKDGSLPSIHPLIDFCNAASLASAIPVAVFDMAKVGSSLQVRYATGTEEYLAFGGEVEHPAPGEVIFADEEGRAHARRWTNRQSLRSAVTNTTRSALLVAEAMHATAREDVQGLVSDLANGLQSHWGAEAVTASLTPTSPRFDF